MGLASCDFALCMLLLVRQTWSVRILRESLRAGGAEVFSSVALQILDSGESSVLRRAGNLSELPAQNLSALGIEDTRKVPYACTERRDGEYIRYMCPYFRLGNALLMYWNARAEAIFNHLLFFVDFNRTDILSKFPAAIARDDQAHPTPSQLGLYMNLHKAPSVCWKCFFPHGNPYSPWRVVGDLIFRETQSVVQNAIQSSGEETKNATSWTNRQNWAVFHYRCDPTIYSNEKYGFLPHRFIIDRLPENTSTLLLVGQVINAHRCLDVMIDLVSHLWESRKIKAGFQEGSPDDDWLTLATAPLLFCSPSTFCLTAGMGNPNPVYFPTSGVNMAVLPDGPLISKAERLRSPNFHWVETDYLPGPAAHVNRTSWEAVRAYLRSDGCVEEQHPCVAIGGDMPQRFRSRPAYGIRLGDR